jgi:AraC family transcriptional regulator of arabinose operon
VTGSAARPGPHGLRGTGPSLEGMAGDAPRRGNEDGPPQPGAPVPPIPAELLPLLAQGVQFTFHDGAISAVGPGSDTGWRTLPYAMFSACDCAGVLELEERTFRGSGRPLGGACVPAGVHHRCATTGGSSGTSWWCCASYTVHDGLDLFALLEIPLVPDEREAVAMRATITELIASARIATPSISQLVRIQILGLELLAALAPRARWRTPSRVSGGALQRLLPLFAHIQGSLHRPLPVQALARRCGLSPKRFHQAFRAATGLSPHAYLLRRRLHKAQRLLLTTADDIAAVARAVGMDDAFYFSRWFRARAGLSPRAYRERISQRMALGAAPPLEAPLRR